MESFPLPSFMTTALRSLASATNHSTLQGPERQVNPLTYPKSAAPFSDDLFSDPTAEYRGCPFWAWNSRLDKDQLLRQIDNFADMGMGGFHMHVRTGLDTQYMGTEFMRIVRSCVEYAEKKNLLACLYDDDRWPSGAAGGKVIKDNPEHKAKHILFTPHLYGTVELDGDQTSSSARACRSENGFLLATYDIELDENGCLKSSRKLKEGELGTNMWYAYVETNPGSPWFNGETYVDTLSPDAMARFIEISHEVYKDKVGDKFGTVVPCIFTDEPQFATKTQLSNSGAKEDVFLPWTSDLMKTFSKAYSADLVDQLPQLVWNLAGDQPSLTRYRYHDHVCERFVNAFMDQLGGWCKKNGIMLNGHMMEEPTLYSQTTALGEAMRCYRSMEMPGIDLLVDGVEYNTAKQASSVARQNGVRGCMSEIYGCTHWYFTFEGHKGCGDWQAALGITFRVHHLTWVSMAGEGKRDYPACIGYQSPWFREYGYIEDHFARVGCAMTRGKALNRVGVIHPIESYWLCFGPNQSGDEMAFRNQAFSDLTNWLLHGLIDFDFISESLLPGQVNGKQKGNKLHVGKCVYDVIILPNLRTIRSSTLKILQDFSKAGGKIIIAGSAPDLIDAKIQSSRPAVGQCKNSFWSKQSILSTLEEYRDLRVLTEQGLPAEKLLYQMREDGDERFVFICNTDRTFPVTGMVQLKGLWKVTKLDTLTGEQRYLQSRTMGEWTTFQYKFEGCASLLLRLSPTSSFARALLPLSVPSLQPATTATNLTLDHVSLSEPNVLLLDFAQYWIDSTLYPKHTEVLKIDNLIRNQLKLPRKGGAFKQPWSIPLADRGAKAQVVLLFTFESAFNIKESTMLALEDAESMEIYVNDVAIPSSHQGNGKKTWWVDEAITTLPIPGNTIKQGTNTITLSFPFGILTNIERIYLLGAFAVSFTGPKSSSKPLLQPLDLKSLTWGDITTQGLPFYVGNITYNCSFTIPSPSTSASASKSNVILKVPDFSSPVLTVTNIATETKLGRIALQPHTLDLGAIKEGEHEIAITAFGNRYNSFGHIHLPDGITNGCWPDIFRSKLLFSFYYARLGEEKRGQCFLRSY